MSKREFLKEIALEFKIRSGASFRLSKRQLKLFRKWINKQNEKKQLLSSNEIQLILINLIIKSDA